MIYDLSIDIHINTISGIGDYVFIVSHITSEFNCRFGSLSFNYLSLPLKSRVLDCKSWDHVVNMVRSRLAQWKSCHLSVGGKLILINFVLNIIHIYALSIRVLSIHVSNNQHSLMSKFMWGESDNSRKLHLIDWNTVSMPMERAGLDISKLEDLSAGLIVKWIYSFANERDSFWGRVVGAK